MGFAGHKSQPPLASSRAVDLAARAPRAYTSPLGGERLDDSAGAACILFIGAGAEIGTSVHWETSIGTLWMVSL